MEKDTTEIIITSQSRLRQPLQLLREMFSELFFARGLIWQFILRDIRAQYRSSLLGAFWAFVPPLIMAIGLTMARKAKIIMIGETDLPYPAYVIFSMTLWQTFTASLNSPAQGLLKAKAMMAKIYFPREAVVLARQGTVIFNFLIKLILITAVFIWFDVPITRNAIFAPGALLMLMILGFFLGLAISPLAILLQDFSRILALVTGPWLFLTPVIYPVPEAGFFSRIVQLNPVTPMLITVRELATSGVVSDPERFFTVSLITIIFSFFAWIFFRVSLPLVIERMSF